jgi:hypothetical protein
MYQYLQIFTHAYADTRKITEKRENTTWGMKVRLF